jgi:hypothetical protein
MRFHRRSYLALVLGLSIASISPQAQAGSYTEMVSTSPGLPTDFSKSLSVNPFDSMNGTRTLESVVLSYTDNLSISGTIANNSGGPETFTFKEDVKFTLALVTNPTTIPPTTTTLLSNDPSYSIAATLVNSGDSLNVGPYSASSGAGPTTIDPLNPLINIFAGSDPVVFTFSTVTSTAFGGGGGNDAVNVNTLADATVSVTYNFTTNNVVVPEPASLAMTTLGGLLAAATGYARRRVKAGPLKIS